MRNHVVSALIELPNEKGRLTMIKNNPDSQYQLVSFKEAKEIMDSSNPYVFADVRTEEEYLIEHAEGAILFPLDDIDASTAQKQIPSKDTVILLYCRTGRRSKMAAEKLIDLGYQKIYDIGSLAGWPYNKDYGF